MLFEPIPVMVEALGEADLVGADDAGQDLGIAGGERLDLDRAVAGRRRHISSRVTKIQPSVPMNLMPFGRSPEMVITTPLA